MEAIYRIESVSPAGVGISVSTARLSVRRFVRAIDLEYAHRCLCAWSADEPQIYPGATADSASASVLDDLQADGSTLFVDMWPSAQRPTGRSFAIGQSAAALRLMKSPASVSLLVDDKLVDVPVVHARGVAADAALDFYWLKQRQFPLLLHGSVGSGGGWIVKAYTPSVSLAPVLEQSLAAERPATLYGIFFIAHGAWLRPESFPALDALAAVLRRQPSWRVQLAMHTDEADGWDASLRLSQLRAHVIGQYLEQHDGIAGARLRLIGSGAAQSIGDNDTVSGRALNRRLVVTRF